MSHAGGMAVATGRPRRAAWPAVFGIGLSLAFAGFVALGVWQLQRMAWKHDLVERVDARLHAEPVPVPRREAWAAITDEGDSYRRVRLSGHYLPTRDTRTQAVTALGGGWWSLAPFRTVDGDIVLVNRGFVPSGEDAAPPPTGQGDIVGLLRTTEPGGGFLRKNRPAEDRWYSRDVEAIARARGLPAEDVAPFFVDAARDAADAGWPRGGMTVVAFRDHHLSYALTWFGMALLTAVAGICLFVLERRLRQHGRQPGGPDHAGPTRSR